MNGYFNVKRPLHNYYDDVFDWNKTSLMLVIMKCNLINPIHSQKYRMNIVVTLGLNLEYINFLRTVIVIFFLLQGNFFANIGSIVVFAVFGTLISAAIVGGVIFVLGKVSCSWFFFFISLLFFILNLLLFD